MPRPGRPPRVPRPPGRPGEVGGGHRRLVRGPPPKARGAIRAPPTERRVSAAVPMSACPAAPNCSTTSRQGTRRDATPAGAAPPDSPAPTSRSLEVRDAWRPGS